MAFLRKDWKKIWKTESDRYAKAARKASETEVGSRFSQIWIMLSNEFFASYISMLEDYLPDAKAYGKYLSEYNQTAVRKVHKLLLSANLLIYLEKDERSAQFFEARGLNPEDFEKEALLAWEFGEEDRARLKIFRASMKSNYERFVTEHAKAMLDILGLGAHAEDARYVMALLYYRTDSYEREFMAYMDRLAGEKTA